MGLISVGKYGLPIFVNFAKIRVFLFEKARHHGGHYKINSTNDETQKGPAEVNIGRFVDLEATNQDQPGR